MSEEKAKELGVTPMATWAVLLLLKESNFVNAKTENKKFKNDNFRRMCRARSSVCLYSTSGQGIY